MADSDEEYVGSSGDERGGKASRKQKKGGQDGTSKERWEEIQRSWDNVVEGEDGSIAATVVGLLEMNKRKRFLKDTTPLQRGIIRHLVLVLDLSVAMEEKDFRPTRFLLQLSHACDFIKEYFEQNPISQLCVIGMCDGLAMRISDMSGNPVEHISSIRKLRQNGVEPKGSPSLQNALDMARGCLWNAPTHGTKEILIVFGALHTCDPGDIHLTIKAMVQDKIEVRIVGLAAQVAVCSELVKKTNSGSLAGYGVAMDEKHFRDLLMANTTPPPTRQANQNSSALLTMGFPSRFSTPGQPTLCVCHSNSITSGYKCPRCMARVCTLPTSCPACDLTLVLSTHLARSYHHLFPLANFVEVPRNEVKKRSPKICYSCEQPFPKLSALPDPSKVSATAQLATRRPSNAQVPGVNSVPSIAATGRYACLDCGKWFCVDCDIFCHEEVYNCPGCEADPEGKQKRQKQKEEQKKKALDKAKAAAATAGNAMEIDG